MTCFVLNVFFCTVPLACALYENKLHCHRGTFQEARCLCQDLSPQISTNLVKIPWPYFAFANAYSRARMFTAREPAALPPWDLVGKEIFMSGPLTSNFSQFRPDSMALFGLCVNLISAKMWR